MARGLGIELHADCTLSVAETAGGKVACWIYKRGLTVFAADTTHHLKASFCEGLKVPLLGREDFFEGYRVTFDQRTPSFTLEPYEPQD